MLGIASLNTANQSYAVQGEQASKPLGDQVFLRLFIEQLRNQDPLSPPEPGQLLQQLALMEIVSELRTIRERLDQALQGGGEFR